MGQQLQSFSDESGHFGIDVLMPEKTETRRYDDRVHKARKLIMELLELGVVPRVIQLDGLHIEVAEYRAPATLVVETQKQLPPGVLATEQANIDFAKANVRSYRNKAREDLRQKLREAE